MSILLWVIVGLVAGWLASLAVGGGFGLLGDMVIGIIGAFIGGAIFRAFDIASPLGGVVGTILVAFLGAVVLLLLLRLIRRTVTP